MEVLDSAADREGADSALDSFWSVRAFDEVDSTNTRIKEAITEGAPEGTCFVARRQSAAYGRQGRTWSSPEGGLYFSFILDPLGAHPDAGKTLPELPPLSLLLSLAVQSALTEFTKSTAIKIKWPNDILVVQGNKATKLCGISLEAVNQKLCCGIGINVECPVPSSNNMPGQKGFEPVYLTDLAAESDVLHDRTAVLEQLLPCLLKSIESLYGYWLSSGIVPLISRYNESLYNLGDQVSLEALDGTLLYSGEVQGVAETGELLLRAESGEVIRANSGEVHTHH